LRQPFAGSTHRVWDWLGQRHYRDPQEFVESIPFTETREYVRAGPPNLL
jgi:soluble lytic murein transglycosylase-like protein